MPEPESAHASAAPDERIVESLGGARLFVGVDDTTRRWIAAQMRTVRYAAGEILFARGDRGNLMYLVLEGRVRLSVLSADAEELSFHHAGPGEIFGEIGALDGGDRPAGATALSDTLVAVLAREVLLQLIEAKPSLARATIEFLCSRVRSASAQLEAIALHQVEARVARLLLVALKMQGYRTGSSGRPSVSLDMTQVELAQLLGASRQKVNRAIDNLERGQAVARDGDIWTCDPAALTRVAEKGS